MTLSGLLLTLRERGLTVHAKDGKLVLRGGPLDDDLRGALAEHKPHLLRLYRGGPARWRSALAQADDASRDVWALLAHGYEAQGVPPRAADFLAWHDVND